MLADIPDSPCRIFILLGLSLPSLRLTLSLNLPTCVYYHCYTDYNCHIRKVCTLLDVPQGMGLAGIPRVEVWAWREYPG